MADHFPLADIIASDRASRLGIDNSPSDMELANINTILKPGLEMCRVFLGDNPVYLNSGFRSRALNAETPGSSDTSAHTLGYAADIRCPGFGEVWEVCNTLSTALDAFDQIIYEYGAWCHVSFDPRNRKMLLTKLSGQPYRNGLHKT